MWKYWVIKLLGALSIPLIGDTASKKIGTLVNNIESLYDETGWGYVGLGPTALHNLFSYLEDNLDDVEQLESYFTFTELKELKEVEHKGNVCITGKLNDFSNRTKAKEFLEEHGYTVTSTVSSKTDYLVCEDGSNSSKNKKAVSLGIPIVLIVNLIKR
jgi:DNA ligase (NAD+)